MLSGSVKERKEHHMTWSASPSASHSGFLSLSIDSWLRSSAWRRSEGQFVWWGKQAAVRMLIRANLKNRENKAACPANHWKPELLGKSGAKPSKWKCQEFGLFLICFCFRVFHVAGSWFTFISYFFPFLWILVLQVCESVIGLVTSCLTLVVFCPLCCHF